MPLFRKKSRSKKVSPRKLARVAAGDPADKKSELGLNYSDIKLKLGKQRQTFMDGSWANEEEEVKLSLDVSSFEKLVKEHQRVKEENNFLRVKIEVLLNLMSEMKAKSSAARAKRGDGVRAPSGSWCSTPI